MSNNKNEPIIKNLEIINKNYDNFLKDLSKNYSNIELSNDQKKEIKNLLPKYHYNHIKYELHNVELALSNGWRRVMIDEIEYPRLSTRMDDIKTDDDYNSRLTDYIQNRIYMIPISYSKFNEAYKNIKLEINVENNEEEEMIIKSSSIEFVDNQKCPIVWVPDIPIITLRSKKFLKVPISIEWGKNLNHHTFSCFARTSAFPLGSDTEEKLDSSLTTHPTKHVNSTWVLNFTEPKFAVKLGWETLLNILKKALVNLEDFKKINKIPYNTLSLKVMLADAGKIRYEFFNETRTLTEIICRYSYLIDKKIKLIYAGDDHPEDKSSLIYINHDDHVNLLISGTKNAIKIIEKIIKLL